MPWAVTANSHARITGLGRYRIGDDLTAELVRQHDGSQVFIGPYTIDYAGNFRFIEFFRGHITAVSFSAPWSA
jgi:hypothetical protein